MIKITRFNGQELAINAELIQFVESTPDTVITLVNKEKILVRESVDEVTNRIIKYHRSIHNTVNQIRVNEFTPSHKTSATPH